jgi:carboxylesterase type B
VINRIHGGGYVLGSKDDQTVPEGLMAAASANGEDIILVQINHRLGAFGWLAGPSVAASGGVSNAALYDQRLAIEWVAKYIGRFGGDPKRITLLGVSAGGGGIMHQITAFGGKKGVSFQRAVPQSAGWVMKSDRDVQENTTRTFLQILGVNTIEEARQLPSDKVIAANTKHIREYSTWGLFTYGPVVDGVFVPEQPSQLLAKGAFAKDVKILPGHETYEGVIFVDPRVKSDEVIEGWLRGIFKTMSQDVMDYILKILYPPTFDGSFPYTTQLDRAIFLAGEAFFSCNTYYVNTAQRNTSYAYQFDVFPSLHGSDQPYTWYNGEGDIPSQRLFANVALVFQGYITNFAKTGTPNGKGLPKWPVYGKDGIELGINYPATSIKPNPDSAANERCVWWQKALFD